MKLYSTSRGCTRATKREPSAVRLVDTSCLHVDFATDTLEHPLQDLDRDGADALGAAFGMQGAHSFNCLGLFGSEVGFPDVSRHLQW